MYKAIDVTNALDMRTMEYAVSARADIGGGYNGTPKDLGHLLRKIYRTDTLSLTRVCQGAGLPTCATNPDSFVLHTRAVEIEYILTSVCDLSYPNGDHVYMDPGDCLVHQPGQPHKMEPCVPVNMEIAIFVPGSPKVDRVQYNPADNHPCDKYAVKKCTAEVEPDGKWGKLVEFRRVFENNEDAIAFAEVTLKPGGEIPLQRYIKLSCNEIVLVRSGEGIAVYPDKTYKLYPDMSFFNEPGQVHKYINTGKENLVLLVAIDKYNFDEAEMTPCDFES